MRRAAIAAIALLLGLGALPVIVVAGQISEEPTCRDVGRSNVELEPGEDCFPGSTARQSLVVGLLYGAGATAIAAMVAGAAAAWRNGLGVMLVLLAILAALLFAGAYGAARV